MIFVNTPTGNIGVRATENLIRKGAEVSVLARRPEKLPEMVRRNANVVEGNLEDAALLAEATKGAEAMLWVIPANVFAGDLRRWYHGHGRMAVEVVRANRIPHVVFVSSGGYPAQDAGPVTFLHEVEGLLDDACEGVCHLRCGCFMENFLWSIDSIREGGSFSMPMDGSVPIPMVCTSDIGDVATERLMDRRWSGRVVHPVHGPAHLSLDQAAVEMATALSRPVRFVRASGEQTRAHYLRAGMTPDVADRLLMMYDAFAEGIYEREPRTPETTTPTTLSAWTSSVLAPAMDAS